MVTPVAAICMAVIVPYHVPMENQLFVSTILAAVAVASKNHCGELIILFPN
jgi:hypothetical protein